MPVINNFDFIIEVGGTPFSGPRAWGPLNESGREETREVGLGPTQVSSLYFFIVIDIRVPT